MTHTFSIDAEMQERLKLDGVVALVDACHIWERLADSEEAQEQIAFADVIRDNGVGFMPG
jgi:G3E family GTPase